MKLKGFTLAEVLVTLTVVGVIAALVLPALNTNVAEQQVGPTLRKAISTLDNANMLMMQENEIYSFPDTCIGSGFANDSYPNNCFDPFLKATFGAGSVNVSNMRYEHFVISPNAEKFDFPAGSRGYTTKFGFDLIFADRLGSGEPLSNYQKVYIDVNGMNKGPNRVAMDLFLLVMDLNEGRVYANGSRYLSQLDDQFSSWEQGGCDRNSIGDPFTCAGSVIDNGGRVIYR